MEKIALFYLAKPKYGGWVTFTSHLLKSFEQLNIPVFLFKIGNKTESKQRHFNDDVNYQNVDIKTAINISKNYKTIITAQDKNYLQITDELLSNNANLIVHDPTEMKQELIETIKKNNIKPITIRKINCDNLNALGIDSNFIQHPYIRYNKNEQKKNDLAVATSRLDFDKHTEIIVEANLKLSNKIKIYGAENRLYTYFKLKKIDEHWDKNYFGKFSNHTGNIYNILNPHKFMIDMSAIKKDGGGSQYTFLEAWDSGCIVVLNKKWNINSDDTMKANINCLFVNNSEDLVNLLQKNNDYESIIKNGYEELQYFEGKKVAEIYLKVM